MIAYSHSTIDTNYIVRMEELRKSGDSNEHSIDIEEFRNKARVELNFY